MADDKKISEKKQRLLALLREMFQLDQPDLDFGLYRIMHAKRGQVEAFLDTEFDQLIDKVFADRGARHEEEAKNEYESVRDEVMTDGGDPETSKKVQQARARYEVVRLTGGEDAEIYDHLHRFFSRYYDQGDFMSLRRYGKGAAGGAETYAVPYDGSEVVLHWANKDQYYIKTTENFAEFSFDPRKALQKDERGMTKSIFGEEVGAGGTALKVHFRIVDAAEGAHNNVKASDKDERYFILDEQAPNAWDGTDLVIPINYRPDPEKSGQKAKWQEKRNEQLVSKVIETLKGAADGGHALAREYFEVLSREVPKGKDKKQTLLARYVGQYTASNTMDYFIHKDLGGFLRRELDFYLKNEVIKLDDFVGGEDADVQSGLTDARIKAMKEALEKAQAIRLLSQRLIDFLAQLEEFQKKLWLKKKFVVETQYCITLDRIPEKFYPEIAANERQREEWVKLFAIDEIKGDMTAPPYTVPLTLDFLRANQELIVDTTQLPASLASKILSEVDGIDEACAGTLIHSDNYQALNLINLRFAKNIDCIHIDPPYNTATSGFLYKNGYQHSSWLALMHDRITASIGLMSPRAVFQCHIDENEYEGLFQLFAESGIPNSGTLIWDKKNPMLGRKGIATQHEYILWRSFQDKPVYMKNDTVLSILSEARSVINRHGGVNHKSRQEFSRWMSSQNDLTGGERAYRLLEDDGRVYRGVAMGAPEPRADPKFHIPLTHPKTQKPCPIPTNGWSRTPETLQSLIDNNEILWGEDHTVQPQKKVYLTEESQRQLASVIQDAKSGKAYLDGLGLAFPYCHPVSLYEELFGAVECNGDGLFLDYFAGSGTTAHAVVNLNRQDGGSRKFVLIEQGDYFSTVLKPRIQKVVYSTNWKDGKPITRLDRLSYILKVIRLESYEDCLNNLVLNGVGFGEAIHHGEPSMQRDYLLRYMLDVETHGSQSLLNVAQFRDPTAYQLEIKKPGSDEREKRNVDLVETFNWLIGLHVDKLHAGRRFNATFARKPDPLLPEDANTRLQVETLTEAADGAWWFRPVEGYVRTKPGDDRHRQSVLVLWRTLTDDPEQDAAALEAFLSQQMKFDPTRREDKTLYDIIYINGTHNLPNLGKYGEVRLLEEEFHRRMWAIEEN
jgi:adenine-specific DNA-methyltransferase